MKRHRRRPTHRWECLPTRGSRDLKWQCKQCRKVLRYALPSAIYLTQRCPKAQEIPT